MPPSFTKQAIEASNNQSVRVNWKSVVGAAANGAKSIFSPVMPATVNTATSISSLTRDLRDATRVNRTNVARQQNALNTSPEMKKAKSLFNAAMSDIENGSYSIDKVTDEMSDDFQSLSEDFKMPTGDDAANMSSEEILMNSNKGIAKSVMQSSNAQLRGMQSLTNSIIRANIKTSQAMGGMITNSVNRGFGMLNTTLTITNKKLTDLSTTINTINQFNNSNTLEYYTKSIDMLNGLGKMMDNLQKTMSPDPRKTRKFDISNGFNVKEYIKYVKEGIQETLVGSTTAAIKGATGKASSGADGGLLSTIVSSLIPKSLSKPLEKLDKTVQRFFKDSLERIADTLDSSDLVGAMGLGRIFGNKRETRNRLSLEAYSKDALPWNGLAQKALVEVIPELLTSIDAGINKTEKRYYDYDKGKFLDKSKIESDFEKEYFDRLAFSLKDAMKALETAASESGRSSTDQDRLIRHIESLISDQVTGKVTSKNGRRSMERSLYDFGVDETSAKKFIEEFQEGIENGLKEINDFFHNIGSTQNIYRNIHNSSGTEFMRSIDRMHNTKGGVNYRQIKSLPDPAAEIRKLQKRLNLTDINLENNEDLISELIILSYNGSPTADMEAAVAAAYQAEKAKDVILNDVEYTGPFSKIINRANKVVRNVRQKGRNINARATALGQRVEGLNDKLGNITYELSNGTSYYAERKSGTSANTNAQVKEKIKTAVSQIPNQEIVETTMSALSSKRKPLALTGRDKKSSTNKATPSEDAESEQTSVKALKASTNVGKASTFMSKKRQKGDTSSSDEAANIGVNTALIPFDRTMKSSTKELDQKEKVLKRSIEEMDREELGNDVETTIVQSNNRVSTMMGMMLHHLQGFTARLFGKDGFISKLWNSESRKKATDKLKKKLFTGEDAIFKKQYEGLKRGTKRAWLKTKYHLGKGYNYLYDNTMTYLYGHDDDGNEINYRDNERYKNNKFVSQTVNLRWRKEQARKKRAEERKRKAEEEAKLNGASADNATETSKEDTKVKSSVNTPTSKDDKDAGVSIITPDKAKESTTKDESKEDTKVKSSVNTPSSKETTSEIKESTEKLKSSINTMADSVADSAEALEENVDAAVKTIAGDPKTSVDKKKKDYQSNFVKKLKSTIPKAMAGAIAGFGIGMLNNSFSILGSMFLPGGPIAGAIVGGGLSILSQSEAFKTFMFGKLDEKTGKKQGGLISEKTRERFRKLAPTLIGGAVVGGLSSILKGALGFNTGLGVMGMQILPGGILGGAILGAGMGILKNSETFKSMLFGKKDSDGHRTGTMITKSWDKAKSGMMSMLPKIKTAGKGLALGALTGAVLSKMGYIPAMLSMGGPVGMGVVGLGLGIAASTNKFNEWMFGSKMVDKDGNVIGRNKDGMLTRVTNILRVNVVEPIATTFKNKMLDLVDWTKEKITYPFRLAFGPILDSLIGIKDSVVDFVKDKFEMLGNGIMDMMRKTMKTLFNPITKLIGFIGKSMVGAASAGAKTALFFPSMALQGLSVLTAGKRRKEYAKFYKNYYSKGNISGALRDMWSAQAEDGKKRNIFGKVSDVIGAYMGSGPIGDAARAGWNAQMADDGKDHLRWREVPAERRQLRKDRKQRKIENKQWEKIDKFRKRISDQLGGREVTFNDATVKEYREKFAKLGINKDYLENSDDLMELIYHKRDFQNRIKNDGKAAIINTENPEQAKAREKTSEYQDHVSKVLDAIQVKFGILAKDVNDQERMKTAEEEWQSDLEKLKKRMKKRGMKGIDLDDPSLRDYDISKMDDDMINGFRWSSDYLSGNLKAFMDRMKITKKSEYVEGEDEKSSVHEIEPITAGLTVNDTPAQAEFKDNLLNAVNDIKGVIVGTIAETTTKINNAVHNSEELTEKIVEQNKDLIAETASNTDANEAQAKELKEENKKRGNFFTNLFKRKKRKEKDDQEKKESEESRSGTSSINSPDNKDDNAKEEEEPDGPLGKIFGKIKTAGKLFAGTKIGKGIIGAGKFLGALGLLSTVGLTIAEIIRPGTASKVGGKIDAFNKQVDNGEFSFKSVLDDVKVQLASFGNWVLDLMGPAGDWIEKNIIPFFKDKLIPTVGKLAETVVINLPEYAKTAGEFVAKYANTIVGAFTTVIKEVAPPLITALVKSAPDIVIAIGKGIFGGLVDLGASIGSGIMNALGFGGHKEKTVENKEAAEKEFEESGLRFKKNEITSAKTSVSSAEAQKTLDTGTAEEKNAIIMSPATGQYYVYKEDGSTSRAYITAEVASEMLTSPNTANELFYEPRTGKYFIEEATHTAWSDTTYSDPNGKRHSTRTGDVFEAVGNAAQLGVNLASGSKGALKGLKAITGVGRFIGKNGATIGKVAGTAGNLLGKTTTLVGKGLSGAGSLLGIFGAPLKMTAWATKTVGKGISKASKAFTNLTAHLGPKAAAKAAETVVDSSEGIIAKFIPKITNAFKGIANSKALKKVLEKSKELFGMKVDDILKKMADWLIDISRNHLGKAKGKLAAEVADLITRKVGKSVITSVPVVAIVSGVWGATGGYLSAANLFGVPEDKVDWKMRLISTVMETLMNISFGAWFDLAFSFVDILTLGKVDLKSELACWLYKTISLNQADATERLYNAQESLDAERAVYNALNNENLSSSAYNDKTNKTGVLSHLWSATKSGWNWLTGNKEGEFLRTDATKTYTQILTEAGYTGEQISSMKNEEVIAAVKSNVDSSSIGDKKKKLVKDTIDSFGSAEGYGPGTIQNNGIRTTNSFKHIPLGYGNANTVNSQAVNIMQGSSNVIKNAISSQRTAPLVSVSSNGTIKNNPDSGTASSLSKLSQQLTRVATIYRQDAVTGTQLLPRLATAVLSLFENTANDTAAVMQTLTENVAALEQKSEDIQKKYAQNIARSTIGSVTNIAKRMSSPFKFIKRLGLGPSPKSDDFYKQGNSSWAGMQFGVLPSGAPATMENAGCGPTALAAVTNKLALGYGPAAISPADMASYAASNGYISQGGANAGLFTEGAARLGLNASPVSDSYQLQNNLMNGTPTILTGKSSSNSNPYTSAGHIVVADGMVGDKASVLDPITGKRKLYNINDVSRSTNHAWSYSLGYGFNESEFKPRPSGLPKRKPADKYIAPKKESTTVSSVNKPPVNLSKFKITGNTQTDITAKKMAIEIANGTMTLSQIPFSISGYYDKIKADAETFKNATKEEQTAYIMSTMPSGYNLPSMGFVDPFTRLTSVSDIVKQVTGYSALVTKAEETANATNDEGTVETTTSDSGEVTVEDTAGSGGIGSLEELRAAADQYKGLSKFILIGKIVQAQVDSLMTGNPFWQCFKEATSTLGATNGGSSSSGGGGGGVIQLSRNLSAMQQNPKNIQEELLAKTLENTYYEESHGNYGAINANDNGLPSIGPYQARGNNAVTLLNNLINTDGISGEVKNVYKKYIPLLTQRPLVSSEAEELSAALNNSEAKEAIQKTVDTTGMQLLNDVYYAKYLSKYYDDTRIKDFKTLPMLADIGNAGIGFIVGLRDKSSKWSGKTFIDRWNPTPTADGEFDKAYETLVAPGSFYNVKGYKPRITRVYNRLKNYTFKTTVPSGRTLNSMFAQGTNPLGFGPDDENEGTAPKNLGEWSQQIGNLATGMLKVIGDTYGSPELFGIGTNTSDSGEFSDSTTMFTNNGSTTGSYQGNEQLVSITGSDKGRILAAARSQLGYMEKRNGTDLKSFKGNAGKGSYSKYGKEIGSNPNHWCAYFTSWLGKAANVPTSIYPRDGRCTTIAERYNSKGQFFYRGKGTPQTGDLIFYTDKWAHLSDPSSRGFASSHIGLVTSYDGGSKIKTIEGNTSTPGGGDGVAEKDRAFNDQIMGFARPQYSNTVRTVNPSEFLSLGYGKGTNSHKKAVKFKSTYDTDKIKATLKSQIAKQKQAETSAAGYGPDLALIPSIDTSKASAKLISLGYGEAQFVKNSIDDAIDRAMGYGNELNISNNFNNSVKIDDVTYREKIRERMNNQPDYQVNEEDFAALGFGPGMKVDAGFDMSNTDQKLDQIVSIIGDWYSNSKKAATSSETKSSNVNIVKQDNYITPQHNGVRESKKSKIDTNKYKSTLAAEHATLSYRKNIRDRF